MADFQSIVEKCRSAQAGDWGVVSTGEQLMAALVLNRADWIESMGYTIPDALNRLGPEWVSMIPDIQRVLADEHS